MSIRVSRLASALKMYIINIGNQDLIFNVIPFPNFLAASAADAAQVVTIVVVVVVVKELFSKIIYDYRTSSNKLIVLSKIEI